MAGGAVRDMGARLRRWATRLVISSAGKSNAGIPDAGRPTWRNAAGSVGLRAAICTWILGPPSPPVASAPWQRAQRVSYARRPGSDWAEARRKIASERRARHNSRIWARYQVRLVEIQACRFLSAFIGVYLRPAKFWPFTTAIGAPAGRRPEVGSHPRSTASKRTGSSP